MGISPRAAYYFCYARPELTEPKNEFIAVCRRRHRKTFLSGPSKSTVVAGVLISALVIAAIASIGYFQYDVAPKVFTTPSTLSTSSSALPPAGHYVNVTILEGAGSPGAQGFAPANITVVIGVNATVVWTNDDQGVHTVTSVSAPAGASFDSTADLGGYIQPGGIYIHNFTVPGNYQYHCSLHYWMQGSVTVLA